MAWKHPDDMTVEEARSEMYSLEHYFDMCAETGDGISSKDSIRHRLCKFKVDYFDQFGREIPEDMTTQEFMDQGHLMFAPVDCDCYVCKRYHLEQKLKEEQSA